MYGLSGALSEELTINNGAVQQSNFGDYHVLQMADVPQIHARIIVSNDRHGRGRRALRRASDRNAVFALTGKRLRHLPMSPDRVRKALA